MARALRRQGLFFSEHGDRTVFEAYSRRLPGERYRHNHRMDFGLLNFGSWILDFGVWTRYWPVDLELPSSHY